MYIWVHVGSSLEEEKFKRTHIFASEHGLSQVTCEYLFLSSLSLDGSWPTSEN